MLREVNEVQSFFKQKFGDEQPPAGTYAVPCDTSRGNAFTKIVLSERGTLSDFHLFWDEALTISWYDFNQDGTPIPDDEEE